jgi:hypothetical protein
VSVLVTAWLWLKSADDLRIGLGGRWFGFSAMFLNFAVARQAFYYAVLPDMTALMIGTAMLYAYLKRSDVLLGGLVALAWFTWVQAACVGVILLVFPRGEESSQAQPIPGLHRLTAVVAILLTCGVIAHGLAGNRGELLRLHPMWLFLPVSIAALAGWLFYGMTPLLEGHPVLSPRDLAGRLLSLRPWLVAGLLLILRCVTELLASPRRVHTLELLTVVLGSGAMRPALFVVAHAVFFGPVVLCVIALWRPVVRELTTFGPGLPLAVAAGVLFSLGSESRWLINFLPLVVPFVARAVESVGWRPAQYVWFAGLCLFFSKLWLPLNLDCPSFYFLNQGPWMTLLAWAAQGAVVLATGFGLWRWCRPAISPVTSARPGESTVAPTESPLRAAA